MTDKTEAQPATLQILHDCSHTFRYLAPRGHTLEDCTRPDYWRQNARELATTRYTGHNPFHKIEVLADDCSWEADLRVISVSEGLVTTRVLRHWKGETKPKLDVPKGYRIEHLTGRGWRALDSNAGILAERLATEDEAIQAAVNHAKKAKGT